MNKEAGEAIGAVAVFQAAARRLMQVLLGDLGILVPYVLARRRV